MRKWLAKMACEDILDQDDHAALIDSLESGTQEFIKYRGDQTSKKDLEYFLEKELDLNKYFSQSISEFGDTALLYACEYRFNDLIKLLLSNGADPNIKSKDGFTPLFALISGHDMYQMVDSKDKLREGLRLLEQYDAEMKLTEDEWN